MLILGIDPATPRQTRMVWRNIIRRCRDPKMQNFPRYGGAGIQVCDRWADSFQAFVEDMGLRPSPQHSIDRINNEGHYEPGNCRWATASEQLRNRSDNHWITFRGRTLVLEDWAKETGIKVGTLWRRLMVQGWSEERSLTEAPGAAQRVFLEYKGRKLHLGEWGRVTGIPWATIRGRLRRGWTTEKALSTPVQLTGRWS